MTSAIHMAVAALVGPDRMALLLDKKALNRQLADSVRAASAQLSGVVIETTNPKVSVKLTSLNLDTSEIDLDFTGISPGLQEQITARIKPAFELTLELLSTAEPMTAFSSVRFLASNVSLTLKAEGLKLVPSAPDGDVLAQIVEAQTRADAIALSGISEADLLRVEGAIAYASGVRICLSALTALQPLELQELFPSVSFGTHAELGVVEGHIVVAPLGQVLFKEEAGCPPLSGEAPVTISKPVYDPATQTLSINTSVAPIQQVRPIELDYQGALALYLPKSILDARFAAPLPAITWRDRGGGFLGWSANATIAFRGLGLSIDVAKRGVLVNFEFDIFGTAYANVDVPYVGRVDVGSAKIEMPPVGEPSSNIQLLLRFVMDDQARLVVVTDITKLHLAKAAVTVDAFGRWLGMAGGRERVIGYLLDYVIGRILAHNLPIKLRSAIKKEIDGRTFLVADLGWLGEYYEDWYPSRSNFSGATDSIMVGIGQAG